MLQSIALRLPLISKQQQQQTTPISISSIRTSTAASEKRRSVICSIIGDGRRKAVGGVNHHEVSAAQVSIASRFGSNQNQEVDEAIGAAVEGKLKHR